MTGSYSEQDEWARYWYETRGVNVFPQPTQSRDPAIFTPWRDWQDKSQPPELFEQLISEGKFRNAEGLGIIPGKVWRGQHAGKYLIFIDLDNAKAIKEFCTLHEQTVSLQDIATKFIVEQHKDDPNRAHVYFYSEIPFIQKASDANKVNIANTTDAKPEAIPAFEVKGLGKHGIAFATKSLHKNGARYEIIGVTEPITLTKDLAEQMMYHLDAICRKYNLKYLENVGGNPALAAEHGYNRALTPMTELLRDNYRVLEDHNRHLDLLRVFEHYLVVDPEHAFEKGKEWNQVHCVPPLDDREVNRQWKDAKNFIGRQNVQRTEKTSINSNADTVVSDPPQRALSVDGDDMINAAMSVNKELQDLGYAGCERLSDTEILVQYRDNKKVRVNFKNDRWEGAFERQMKMMLSGISGINKSNYDRIIAAGLSFLQEVYRATLLQTRQQSQAEALKKFDMRKTEVWRFSLTDVLKMGVDENDIQDSQPPKEATVEQLIRARKGRYIVNGIISSATSVYRMVRGEIFECKNCLQEGTLVYKRPDKEAPNEFKSAAEEMVRTAELSNEAMFKALHEATQVKAAIKCSRCKDDDKSAVMKFKDYDYVPTVDVEVRDPEAIKNEMDGAFVKILGEQETKNISIGEPVRIIGKLEILKNRGKPNAIMFAENVEYTGREITEVTEEDRKWIEDFVAEHGQENVIVKLVEMYAPEIIGHEIVKEGLLMVEVYTGSDIISRASSKPGTHNRERKRIHASLIGPPASAKTWLLKAVVRHVPNSLFVSAQGVASGKSLTAVISKEEEHGGYTTRYGPVALAREAICAINELGRQNPEDQGHLLDAMEEGSFTKTGYGFHLEVRADTSLVVSANPKSDAIIKMQKDPNYKLTLDDVPYLRELISRFDLFFVTRYETDENKVREYLAQKDRMDEEGVLNFDDKIRKYIQYAKSIDPVMSKPARESLNNAYVEMIKRGFGSPRARNTLHRITKAIARLKLKKIADEKDALEALEFYQDMIVEFSDAVLPVETAKDLTCRVMRDILRETKLPILFDVSTDDVPSLVDRACTRDSRVADYIGNVRYVSGNWQLRTILDILKQETGRIMQVQDRPVALKWIGGEENSSMQNGGVSDAYDAYDAASDTQKDVTYIFGGGTDEAKSKGASKNISADSNRGRNAASHASHTSDSTPIVIEERLPLFMKRCPHCRFRYVRQQSIDQHIKDSHSPNKERG